MRHGRGTRQDTTHDLDYIKSLPAGDTSVSGYEGMPQMKGMIPSNNEMSAADALLKKAIDSGTMPADVTNVWDGKPYEPTPEFNAKVTSAWAEFHQVPVLHNESQSQSRPLPINRLASPRLASHPPPYTPTPTPPSPLPSMETPPQALKETQIPKSAGHGREEVGEDGVKVPRRGQL